MADTNRAAGGAADTTAVLANSKEQFNILLGNMIRFTDEDMAAYDKCYGDVFSGGVNFSYMASTFFAQFASELLVAALSSNPFRKFIVAALESERLLGATPAEYWDPSMQESRFGLADRDYSDDTAQILSMMNTSYAKIMALNNWYGTDAGKNEFDMYCLSGRAIRDIKAMVCEFPYLIRHYDRDQQFAGEVMEYAGIVAVQIREIAEEG